jgi:ATP-dependent RNA helicase DDX51/DBP6
LESVERVDDDINASIPVRATRSAEATHERPSKRQKVDHQEETELPASGNNPSSPSSLKAALPSFPLPTRPDAPLKHDLALLGLDKALIDAEIIDPNTTMRFRLDSEECASGLTERTRNRLSKLGVSQLFAGL